MILLKGKFSVLREVLPEDAPLYFRLLKEGHLKYYRPYFKECFSSIRELKDFFVWRREQSPPKELECFLYRHQDLLPRGLVSLQDLDFYNRRGELSIILWKPSRKVFMESFLIAIKVGFLNFSLEKIFFYVWPANKALISILDKRQIPLEARLVKEIKHPDTGERYDLLRYCLFKDFLERPDIKAYFSYFGL